MAQRLGLLWLISQKVTHHQAAKLAGVSRATAQRYVTIYRERGRGRLATMEWVNAGQ